MKKLTRVLSILLALLVCACAAAETAPTVDSSVLAVVNGKPVDIVDAYEEYEYYSMLYSLYGYGEEELALLREDIAHYYVQLELVYQQFEALGLSESLDMDAIQAEALAAYEYSAEGYQTYVQDQSSKTAEQIAQEAVEMMESDGYDMAYFERTLYNQERLRLVLEHYEKEVSVTDEEVRAYYDEMVAEEKEYYDAYPAAYEDAVTNGDRVLYTPEGFRAVKHILILLSDEDADRAYELEGELETVELALANSSENTADLTAQKKAIEDEMNEIYASIEPRAQEVLDKLANGEDFLALLDEYGEDPGMTAEPYKTDGYMVYADSTTWVTPFRDGAMALEKPGDVSQPVRTSYGLHIIRYENDVVGGVTPFEDVADTLRDELVGDTFNEYFDGLINQWYNEAEIELHLENFGA